MRWDVASDLPWSPLWPRDCFLETAPLFPTLGAFGSVKLPDLHTVWVGDKQKY